MAKHVTFGVRSGYECYNTFKDTWDLGARGIRARGLSDCVEGSWRD
jgi:hypothetical protein